MRKAGRGLLALLLIQGLVACSPRQLIVGSLADELAAPALAGESDLELLRDAAPFHLKLSESVLAGQPGHLALAESVASGFTQYSYAFVAFEADRIEASDARAADRLRQRAAKLYARAHRHAMTALEIAHPGFRQALTGSPTDSRSQLRPNEVGLAYWAAAAWGGWISLSKDDPEVVADLPLAIRLAHSAWALDPAWGQGALTGLLATFESARPGGSQAQALRWFDLTIEQSSAQSVGALLGKAEGYALPAGDRALFEQLLRQALSIREPAGSPLALQNEVMRRRAAWLQGQTADLF